MDAIAGAQESLVNLSLSVSATGVTITMSAPADGNWFGVGFDTHAMANSPYAIVVDATGRVTEHVLADHAAGIMLNSSVKVISNSVVDGERRVVMHRALKGQTPRHHDFDLHQLSLDFISALGSSPTLSFHRATAVGTVALWPVASTVNGHQPSPSACVCSVPAAPFGQGRGTIEYLGGPAKPEGDEIGFPFRCEQVQGRMARGRARGLTHLLTHSLICRLPHSLNHSLTHSLTHSPVDALSRESNTSLCTTP